MLPLTAKRPPASSVSAHVNDSFASGSAAWSAPITVPAGLFSAIEFDDSVTAVGGSFRLLTLTVTLCWSACPALSVTWTVTP